MSNDEGQKPAPVRVELIGFFDATELVARINQRAVELGPVLDELAQSGKVGLNIVDCLAIAGHALLVAHVAVKANSDKNAQNYVHNLAHQMVEQALVNASKAPIDYGGFPMPVSGPLTPQ